MVENGELKKGSDLNLMAFFKNKAINIVKKHQKLIDKNFEVIMESIVPFIHRHYIKDIDTLAAETCGENSDDKFQVI